MKHYKDFDFEGYKPSIYIKRKGKKDEKAYCDDIITLDLETTSYYIYKGKEMPFDFTKPPEWYIKNVKMQSVMYIWMVGINYVKKIDKKPTIINEVLYGRTYAELNEFLSRLTAHIGARTIIYVHNLSFDFNFLQNSLGTQCEIFARKERKPMKVLYEGYNLEFKCSLFLTNKSLKDAAKEVNAPIEKLDDKFDYNVIRTPLTPLTEEELQYCEHDILLMFYILAEKLKTYGHVEMIPLTQTGQVRRALKASMWGEKKYKQAVKHMWPDYNQFQLLNEAYYGGYVHSNAKYTNKVIKNVWSYDISSSYPFVLCTQKYPVKQFELTTHKSLNHLDYENYAYIMDITITDVEAILDNSFLSLHKALAIDENGETISYKNAKVDNGRIREVKKARFILTDCDLITLNKSYKFKVKVNAIYSASKEYLPVKLINFILKLFKDKTQYKNMKEFESRYKEAKEFINSVYGMFVTKILNDTVLYEHGKWDTHKLDSVEADKILADLINESEQICSYSTGVWCAAYARKHLWDIIVKIDKDVIYCDTDSIKFINEENIKYFEEDNRNVDIDIFKVCQHYYLELAPSDYKIEAPNGEIACLGYFEKDAYYYEFKTLGAKKYAFTLETKKEYDKFIEGFKKKIEEEKDDNIKKELIKELNDMNYVKITVAGVNKISGAKYFKQIKQFAPCTFLDYQYAGKSEVRYKTDQEKFTFKDGFVATEKYGCVIKPTTYLLNITPDYDVLIQELLTKGLEIEFVDNFNIGGGTVLLR